MMKQRKSAVQAASGWLIAIYILVSTWVGLRAVSYLTQQKEGAFHTLFLLASLLFGIIVNLYLHRIGARLFGHLGGFKTLIVRKGSGSKVLENGRMTSREMVPESLIAPYIMGKAGSEDGQPAYINSFIYFMGGPLLNLAVLVISLVLLLTGLVRVDSPLGCPLIGVFFSGLWIFAIYGLPAYLGPLPNDAMKALMCSSSKLAKNSFEKDVAIIYDLAASASGHDFLYQVDLDEDDDVEPMSIFRACYLLRVYEKLVWEGNMDRAQEVLASLYYHRLDLPEELKTRIVEEAVYTLSAADGKEERQLSKRLLDHVKEAVYAGDLSSVSQRSLLAYYTSICSADKSAHDQEAGKLQQYQKKAKDSNSEVAFAGAREGWQRSMLSLKPSVIQDL